MSNISTMPEAEGLRNTCLALLSTRVSSGLQTFFNSSTDWKESKDFAPQMHASYSEHNLQ